MNNINYNFERSKRPNRKTISNFTSRTLHTSALICTHKYNYNVNNYTWLFEDVRI
jgi:hypothetical protein